MSKRRSQDKNSVWLKVPAVIVSDLLPALQSRLQRGIKMEAVAALAGGVSHDFNNLLFGIMGNVELSMRSACDDQKRQLERASRTQTDTL